MKLRKAAFFLLMAALVAAAGCGAKPAAKVDGKAISQDEVDRRLKVVEKESPDLFKGGEGEETKKEVTKQILDGIIEEELLLKEAEKMGIEARDSEVEDQFNQMKEGMSEEDFADMLKQLGTSEDQLRTDIRNQWILEQVREKKIKELVGKEDITDKQVSDYYSQNKDLYKQPAQTQLDSVMLRNEDDAALFAQELAAGKQFKELAAKLGVDSLGGELGRPAFIGAGEADPEIEKAANKLAPNVLSAPINTSDGLWLIRVIKRKEARQLTLKEVKTEIVGLLRAEKGEELFRKWLSGLKKKSKIEKNL